MTRPFPLRQRQCIELLLDGLHDKEIAVALGISGHTVKLHMQHVRQRLDLRNRVQLAAWALNHRQEWEGPPPRAERIVKSQEAR